MKITSKRKFKKELKKMINSLTCEVPSTYEFYHNKGFKIKSYKGIKVNNITICPKNEIFLAPRITYLYE